MSDGVCLPFLLYSTDTVHILRISQAMRNLHRMPAECGADALREMLGAYAGVVCALVESGALLRRTIGRDRLLPVLGMQREGWLRDRRLAFRGVWLPEDFDVPDLCRCHNFTSWSLWVHGALSVLRVYKGRVDQGCNVPVLLIALREDLMRLALPTTALYFAASPDGKQVGAAGRTDECLPKSGFRPVRSDAGVAQAEKEIILPPFCRLTPAQHTGIVPWARLGSHRTLRRAAEDWQLNSHEERSIEKELEDAFEEARSGPRAFNKRIFARGLCLFVTGVSGTWFERERR